MQPIYEREQALDSITWALSGAASDEGRLLLIEGPAGIGKSRLLAEARERARAAGFRELRARGEELEREFAGGVIAQLFEQAPPELDAGGEFALLHGLLTRLTELTESGPLAVIVDDLHWVDAPSLRWLAYVVARFDGLPIAMLIASRPAWEAELSETIARLRRADAARIEPLGPLGSDSIATIVRRDLGEDAEDELCTACASLTAGNPFYLHELLATLRRERAHATRLSTDQLVAAAPASMSRAVLARFGQLPAGAVELARAVAILGRDVELRDAAAVAEIDDRTALTLMDALSTAEILEPSEPLAFVHPLVSDAITADLGPGARAALHLRAAEVLASAGHATIEQVAAQLLDAPRRGNQWTVETLRAAARRAHLRGGTDSAVRLLERALAEPPAPSTRADVLIELGQAGSVTGLPSAPHHLQSALALVSGHRRRAEIGRAHGHALYLQGRHAEAAVAFEAALHELNDVPEAEVTAGDTELRSELEAAYVAAATIDPGLRAGAVARADALAQEFADPLTSGQRAVLAQAALHHSLAAAERGFVRTLALRAWDDGRLLRDETAAGLNWTLVTGALDFSDELERALEICDAAVADARRLGSPMAFATASYERSFPLYHMGRIAEAAADAQHAVDATRYGWEMYARSAAYMLALCQMELGELDAAQETLSILDHEPPDSSIEHPALLDARGTLRLAQGHPEPALADHLEAGRLFSEVFGVLTSGDVDWRLGAAEAALVGGDRARAVELAGAGLQCAQRIGLTRGVVGALRVLGLAGDGEAGIALLRQATEQPDPAPNRLEHLRALVDLGAALRRANRRQDARAPLQEAVKLATARGARALADRALIELRATGARPRRLALSGLESLTPSEQRVARLAAEGATNRQIAQSLFVTAKTVEYHLKHAFQKLGVSSRGELAAALATVAGQVAR